MCQLTKYTPLSQKNYVLNEQLFEKKRQNTDYKPITHNNLIFKQFSSVVFLKISPVHSP